MPQVSLVNLLAAARAGDRLISFPTDTVPALAVKPDRAELLFAVKQRSQTKPLILMGATAADLWQFVTGSGDERQIWQQVAEQYWPGALTLVLPASDRLPPAVNPTDPTTVGLRVPDCAIARCLLAQTNPLATTSANQSGQPPLQTMAEIEARFPEILTLLPSEEIPCAIDASSRTQKPLQPSFGVPSTVAKWEGDRWKILRQGNVKLEAMTWK